jgi:hypothetical protein
MFSGICKVPENLFSEFKRLKVRPKFRQPDEAARIQGIFAPTGTFSAELSTVSGDSFPLAEGPLRLQPEPGIRQAK